MTAQIGDIFKYRKDKYCLANMSEGFEWHPSDFGLNPESCTTACHRGFFCEYTIKDNQLFLTELCIHCKNEKYPLLFGKSCDRDKFMRPKENLLGHCTYSNINIPIEYTGTMLLGNDFIEKYYIGWSVELPHGFKKLFAVEFEKGKVIGEQELSKATRNYRNLMLEFKKRFLEIENEKDENTKEKLIQQFKTYLLNFDSDVFKDVGCPLNDYVKRELSYKELLKLYSEEGLDCLG